jgi:CO/xanthine dehydrogenase Mo-binding subunit
MSRAHTRVTLAKDAPPDIFETPEWRVEGRDKVTGAARYAADITRTGMLQAAFTGSPYPHARVVSVDIEAARKVPGVRAVLTGTDVRPARFGRRLQDWPVLAWDRVRFIGDRVAAVAADTLDAAEAAAAAVAVEYEELPAVFDPEAALAAEAPVLHPDATDYKYFGGARPDRPHPNAQGHVVHEHGDVAAGFESAAAVFEHEFSVPRVHPAFIEPHASLVWIEGETVHVVTTNKAPFSLRDQMAVTIGVPADRIVVDTPHVGGDFGGKGLSLDEFALYFLSRATGKPVRSVLRYADELQISNTRHAARIRLRTGVDREGRITGHQARVVFDGGAYAAGKPVAGVLPGGPMLTLAGYHVPAARLEATAVYTNTIPAGHARAPSQPQHTFAAESHLDLIARAMQIDPVELRARNAIRAGETDVEGAVWHDSQAPRVLATLRAASQWGSPLAKDHGRGVAFSARHVGRGKTSLTLTLVADGSVEVLTGVADQGGGAHTMIQRVVARELGVDVSRVRVRQGDTGHANVDPGVGGSRVTPVAGNAALDGARKLKARVREIGGTLEDAARTAAPLTVTGEGEQNEHLYGVYAYSIEVAVDRATGSLRVIDAVLVADVGTVINPVAVRGQLEGGFIFGLGQALMEELRLEDGRVTTTNLGDYKIPTIADAPPLRLLLITDAPGPGPFGAKSAGELANPAVGAAIANAVDDAVGARVMSLPITAEKVHGLLKGGSDGAGIAGPGRTEYGR